MAVATVELISDSLIKVSGEMDFDNALELKLLGEASIKKASVKFEVNCSEVTRAGSVGISILLSWMRHALSTGKELSYSNLPADLLGVASVSGIDDILPIKQD